MKIPPTLVLLLAITSPLSFATDVLESLRTREGREYFKVEVLMNDDVGIRVRHDAGTARIPYEDLPDSIQSKYRTELKKAAIAKIEATKAENERIKHEEEKKELALLEEKEKKPKKPRPTPRPPKPAVTTEAEPPADAQELEKLEAYIVDMKLRAKEAASEASRLRSDATRERSKTRSVVTGYNGKTGRAMSESRPDKSGSLKATKLEEEADALDRQVAKARVLIGTAEAKYSRLTGSPILPTPGQLE